MLLGSFQPGNGQQTLDCDLMVGAANEVMLILNYMFHGVQVGLYLLPHLLVWWGSLILRGNSHPYKAYLPMHLTRFGEANNLHSNYRLHN